ncbi:SRPBCC domain-containing protein [Nevskia sp.]|uniref:SRPBCC domain-containing protein n=1 Tax=Nevskia sp. TaxID=1929292 RepID=UPI0025D813BD|nr:SRPBCC domain-containing protein [Nevskia sp.]
MPFTTHRDIPAAPAAVFAAIEDSARLARWWGPAGFSNTFELCDFRPDGAWRYVMHGPGGKNYPNESQFEAIERDRRIVIRHVSQPRYRLIISLTPTAGGTQVDWEQAFDDERVASGIAHIVEPANEQNLDRLTAEVLGPSMCI